MPPTVPPPEVRRLSLLIDEPMEHLDVPGRFAVRGRALRGERVLDVVAVGGALLLRTSGPYGIVCGAEPDGPGRVAGEWRFGKPFMPLGQRSPDVTLRIRTARQEAVLLRGFRVALPPRAALDTFSDEGPRPVAPARVAPRPLRRGGCPR